MEEESNYTPAAFMDGSLGVYMPARLFEKSACPLRRFHSGEKMSGRIKKEKEDKRNRVKIKSK